MGLCYRLRQGLGRLRAQVQPKALNFALARRLLPNALWPLYVEMPSGDQWHGLCVARRLMADGWDDRDLLAAALLHDVGKAGGGLTLVHRTSIIIANALHTDWVRRLGACATGCFCRPFYVQVHHAELGAERVRQAGGSDALVALIAGHERSAARLPGDLAAPQQALIAADEAC